MVDFRTRRDKVFDFVNVFLLGVVLLVTAYPVYFVVIASISDPIRVRLGQVVLFPQGVHIDGYRYILENGHILTGYKNSIIYAAGQTLFSLAIVLSGAYVLSRKDFKARGVIMLYLVFTMYFSGGMIPYYVLIKKLGLTNKRLVMMLPTAVSMFHVIVARTFYIQNIPDELLESAQLDGCSNTRFFAQIALPLSRAMVAIIVLFNVVGAWNSFFNALLFLNDIKKYPLQLIIRQIVLLGGGLSSFVESSYLPAEELERRRRAADLSQYALIVAAVGPVLILYPFIQRHFVSGIMVGSLKG